MNKQELARLRFNLVSAVTEYDRKQSTKPSYNMYALPQYLERVSEIMDDIAAGADPRAAISAGFTGTLVSSILRRLKMSGASKGEMSGMGSMVYEPVAKRNPRHGNDDPSRDEMIEHIRKVYGREADEFDIEEAIYWFASDYHGGQGSNLYSALSMSEYRPGRSSSGPEEGSMAEMIYSDLVDTFSPKKNPVHSRKPKQRISVSLSKSRKRNPVYDTGSDE